MSYLSQDDSHSTLATTVQKRPPLVAKFLRKFHLTDRHAVINALLTIGLHSFIETPSTTDAALLGSEDRAPTSSHDDATNTVRRRYANATTSALSQQETDGDDNDSAMIVMQRIDHYLNESHPSLVEGSEQRQLLTALLQKTSVTADWDAHAPPVSTTTSSLVRGAAAAGRRDPPPPQLGESVPEPTRRKERGGSQIGDEEAKRMDRVVGYRKDEKEEEEEDSSASVGDGTVTSPPALIPLMTMASSSISMTAIHTTAPAEIIVPSTTTTTTVTTTTTKAPLTCPPPHPSAALAQLSASSLTSLLLPCQGNAPPPTPSRNNEEEDGTRTAPSSAVGVIQFMESGLYRPSPLLTPRQAEWEADAGQVLSSLPPPAPSSLLPVDVPPSHKEEEEGPFRSYWALQRIAAFGKELQWSSPHANTTGTTNSSSSASDRRDEEDEDDEIERAEEPFYYGRRRQQQQQVQSTSDEYTMDEVDAAAAARGTKFHQLHHVYRNRSRGTRNDSNQRPLPTQQQQQHRFSSNRTTQGSSGTVTPFCSSLSLSSASAVSSPR